MARLPDPPTSEEFEDWRHWANTLLQELESLFSEVRTPVAVDWRPANVPTTGNKSLDADTATLDETRKSLARLIQDLKDGSILGK